MIKFRIFHFIIPVFLMNVPRLDKINHNVQILSKIKHVLCCPKICLHCLSEIKKKKNMHVSLWSKVSLLKFNIASDARFCTVKSEQNTEYNNYDSNPHLEEYTSVNNKNLASMNTDMFYWKNLLNTPLRLDLNNNITSVQWYSLIVAFQKYPF